MARRAHYKFEGRGAWEYSVGHLCTVPSTGGELRWLTQGDEDDEMPSWSPDGRLIAFSRTRSGRTTWRLSDLWLVELDRGNEHRLTDEIAGIVWPSWSPDGAQLACFGTMRDDRLGAVGMIHAWTIPTTVTPRTEAKARVLTEELDRGVGTTLGMTTGGIVASPTWSDEGRTVSFAIADAGCVNIVRVSLDDGTVTAVVSAERVITSASMSHSANRIAFAASDVERPPDLFVCDWNGNYERRLTDVNGELLGQLALPTVERRTFVSPNGGVIDGWLMRSSKSDGLPPLLVDIHGGPHVYHGNEFCSVVPSLYRQVLASRGWSILMLNPLGSGSYGRVFWEAIRGRWGDGDLPDLLAAVDSLVVEGFADPERLAIVGYSYGGFMAAWTIGHVDRFKAAVVGGAVIDLVSFYGTSDIGPWFAPLAVAELSGEEDDAYRQRSPLSYVDQVTAPVLILHGESDERCPIGQGEEYFARLVMAGNVDTEFVRYPGTPHEFVRPSHIVDYCRRVIEWVERYVPVPGGRLNAPD